MFNEYSGTPDHSNALLGIPKGRLGPLVVWGVRGSCCGTLRKLCLTKQARFSQTAATRSGRFICHRQRSHRSPYERSSGALWYFLARKKVHYTYSKPCFNAEKSLTTEVVRLVFALPIFPGSRPPSIVGADELNFCVRVGREPDRRRWRMKGGRSECRGRQETSLLRQAKFLPGTANGNRWPSSQSTRNI